MARSTSPTLLAAQKGTERVPYIRVVINSIDLSSRLLYMEWTEQPYRDYATLVFRNNDRYFDSILDNSLKGQSFQIQPGYTTGAGNEYCGDGTNNGAPTMWVKSGEIISLPGQVVCQLYCEGMWMLLRELYLIAFGGGTEPLYEATFDGTTYTIYDLIEMALETSLSWTLEDSISGGSDSIIDVLKPVYTVNVSRSGNQVSLETFAEFLYNMITLTKCYLRQKAATNWELVYPQSDDSADETYYDNSVDATAADEMVFYEYMEKINEVIPNRIVVAGDEGGDIAFPNLVTGDTGAYSGDYEEVQEVHLYPWITTAASCLLVANAIKTRLEAEGLAGRLIVPHDCRVELYDRVQVIDARGA